MRNNKTQANVKDYVKKIQDKQEPLKSEKTTEQNTLSFYSEMPTKRDKQTTTTSKALNRNEPKPQK